ncbi:hypothetical protein NDU88_001183 [Pleurodeles waltl]|uniref:Uncharacterized protein n=1 Tax=Pleurodeles waltl TaxID=8319 RepID=A0AAV7RA92_PLEWA|nr:hypothetical protein NDU88_001183 [Pleurodeles waltl]
MPGVQKVHWGPSTLVTPMGVNTPTKKYNKKEREERARPRAAAASRDWPGRRSFLARAQGAAPDARLTSPDRQT